ncbi:MAG: nuclear transport factor 2 family protein [Chloroflexi bacterium]|nr:nuclear transport factor 2 family protein [Chloroflexota bacterium]
MLKITINADCGNAPKKLLLRDLNIAFARADVEGILDKFSDDIRWQIIGGADLRGKAAARAALEAMKNAVATALLVHSIITHGREGAVNGVITMERGGSVAYCDVCQFASAAGKKIKSMKSYAVEIIMED